MPRMCCIPLCSSNYRSQAGPTITTFSFPKNEERKQLWLTCIPRENFVPGNSAAVCIKHFKEEYILREVTATRDDGTVLVVARDRPRLSSEAYPSIFEDYNIKTSTPSKRLPNRRGRRTKIRDEEDGDDPPLPTTMKVEQNEEVDTTLGVGGDGLKEELPVKAEPKGTSQTAPSKQRQRRKTSDSEQSHIVMEPEVTIQEGELPQGSVTCLHCKASFASQSVLQVHIASCQLPAKQSKSTHRVRKEVVSKASKTSSILRKSLLRPASANAKKENHDNASKEVLTSDGMQLYKTVIHTGQALYSCEECPALFTSYFHLEEHKKVHPGSQPILVETSSNSIVAPTFASFGKKPKKVKEEKIYCCQVCQEMFKTFKEYRVHRRLHAASKRHCCDVCGKCFQRASKLKVHKRVHTNERPYCCEICNSKFTQLGNLNIHKRTHTGERPFKCDVCKAAFMQPTHLKVHKRCHTGERPYSCTVCSAAFSQMTSLVIHKRTHTGERPYPCEMCGLAFNSRGDLKVHQRRHTGERPYTCNLCQASFTHLGTLNVHKRRHTGKRPFLCDACGVSFITLSELKTHKRRHTGEQPYRCDVCGAGFTQVGSLNTHKRRHQENNPENLQ